MTNDTQKLLTPISEEAAGRVGVDTRGRNIWPWKDSQIDSTSILLKRLENDALQLEPTRSVPSPKKIAKAARGSERSCGGRHGQKADLSISETINYKLGGGFDPYNRS
jgi:hypothetical protein